jgi:hypothetical protein
MCHQITDVTVRPFLHLLNPTRRPRRDYRFLIVDVSDALSPPSVELIPFNYAATGSMRAS